MMTWSVRLVSLIDFICSLSFLTLGINILLRSGAIGIGLLLIAS